MDISKHGQLTFVRVNLVNGIFFQVFFSRGQQTVCVTKRRLKDVSFNILQCGEEKIEILLGKLIYRSFSHWHRKISTAPISGATLSGLRRRAVNKFRARP